MYSVGACAIFDWLKKIFAGASAWRGLELFKLSHGIGPRVLYLLMFVCACLLVLGLFTTDILKIAIVGGMISVLALIGIFAVLNHANKNPHDPLNQKLLAAYLTNLNANRLAAEGYKVIEHQGTAPVRDPVAITAERAAEEGKSK